MADLDGDFEFLVTTARRSIAQLRACTDAHAARGGGPTRGGGLREHIEETVAAIGDRVDSSEVRFAAAEKDIERASVIDSLRLLNRIVTSVHEAAGWLDAAEEPGVHIGVLYFADEAATAIIGVEADVVPVGDAAYQYATVSWPFAPVLSRLKRASTARARPVVVFFPPQESETVLLHSLFAHELAHSAIFEHGLVDDLLERLGPDPEFEADFTSAIGWLLSSSGIDASEAEIRLTEHLRSWLTEFLCDAIAIEYLGPTYLLAFAAVVLSTSWSEPNQTHPPTTLRIGAMLSQLGQRGWGDRLESEIPMTLAWLDGVSASNRRPSSPFENFLVDWTERLADDVFASAASRLGSNAYSPLEFDSVSEEVAEHLSRQILPAQLNAGGPVDRRTIFLSGWLQVFALYEDFPKSISKGIANDEFQDFLGTAMEMSAVLQTWRQL